MCCCSAASGPCSCSGEAADPVTWSRSSRRTTAGCFHSACSRTSCSICLTVSARLPANEQHKHQHDRIKRLPLFFFPSVVAASPLGQVTLQFLAVHNLHVRIQVLPGSGAQGSGESALPAALGAGDEQSASSETPPTHAQLSGERTPQQAVGDEAERSLAELVDASGGGETRERH